MCFFCISNIFSNYFCPILSNCIQVGTHFFVDSWFISQIDARSLSYRDERAQNNAPSTNMMLLCSILSKCGSHHANIHVKYRGYVSLTDLSCQLSDSHNLRSFKTIWWIFFYLFRNNCLILASSTFSIISASIAHRSIPIKNLFFGQIWKDWPSFQGNQVFAWKKWNDRIVTWVNSFMVSGELWQLWLFAWLAIMQTMSRHPSFRFNGKNRTQLQSDLNLTKFDI